MCLRELSEAAPDFGRKKVTFITGCIMASSRVWLSLLSLWVASASKVSVNFYGDCFAGLYPATSDLACSDIN